MARFATDCVLKMAVQVQALEEELGPDTADLGIRVGLHSGPVTAGVLRGGMKHLTFPIDGITFVPPLPHIADCIMYCRSCPFPALW